MSRETLLRTADDVIAGFNTWTPTSVMSFRSPHCTQQILPLSLGRPAMNNEQWLAYFQPLMPAFQKFHVTVQDTVVDERARKVVMLARSTAVTALGEYKNEYVLVCWMTEDGGKVERLVEFVDSGYSVEYMTRLERMLGKERKLGQGRGGKL